MRYIVLILVLISSLICPSFAYEEELFGDEIFIEPEKMQLNFDKSGLNIKQGEFHFFQIQIKV